MGLLGLVALLGFGFGVVVGLLVVVICCGCCCWVLLQDPLEISVVDISSFLAGESFKANPSCWFIFDLLFLFLLGFVAGPAMTDRFSMF